MENIEKELDRSAPNFTLYRYHANRLQEKSGTSDRASSSSNKATVSDFLKKEATTDHNFSLSVAVTTLETETETELRNFIAKRLSKGTVYSGSGNISNLEFSISEDESATCYYCLVRQEGGDVTDGLESSADKIYPSSEFVVCLIASTEASLELFKPELDKYCQELSSILDLDAPGLEATVKPYLEKWQEAAMYYLCRCVARLEEDVKYLIHAALIDRKVELQCDDETTRSDIEKFIECCSMSELMTQIRNESQSNSTPASDDEEGETTGNLSGPPRVSGMPGVGSTSLSLNIQADSHTFDNQECTQFCEDWARELVSGDGSNPLYLRQLIDDYKLKAIQDMNTLKRLMRQAETDHYALYRSYVFLQKCGNGSILLQHARLEHLYMAPSEAQNVLAALESYVDDCGLFPAR